MIYFCICYTCVRVFKCKNLQNPLKHFQYSINVACFAFFLFTRAIQLKFQHPFSIKAKSCALFWARNGNWAVGKEGNVNGVQQLARELHKLMCLQYLLGPIVKLVYDKRNNNRYEAVSTAGIATSSIDLKRGIEREEEKTERGRKTERGCTKRLCWWPPMVRMVGMTRAKLGMANGASCGQKWGAKTTAQTGNGEHLEQWANWATRGIV